MRREEIIARLKEVEPALRARGASALYLFGSHARGDSESNSDVDVFIDKNPAQKFGFDEFMEIYFLLNACLGVEVDYGTRDGLHPALRPQIEQEAIRIF